MGQFFSFLTEPDNHGGKRFYFDWNYRKDNLEKESDSHSIICNHFRLNEDICNKYEYYPLTKVFVINQVNSPVDDRFQVEDWVNKLDFKRVINPIIIKPIINPLELPIVYKPTDAQIELLKEWSFVRGSIRTSIGDSVMGGVGPQVWDSVRDSVKNTISPVVGLAWSSVCNSVDNSTWDMIRANLRISIVDSIWAYASSFFDVEYKSNFTPAIKLWEQGLIPSFSGGTWRLHSGNKADIVYERITDGI